MQKYQHGKVKISLGAIAALMLCAVPVAANSATEKNHEPRIEHHGSMIIDHGAPGANSPIVAHRIKKGETAQQAKNRVVEKTQEKRTHRVRSKPTVIKPKQPEKELPQIAENPEVQQPPPNVGRIITVHRGKQSTCSGSIVNSDKGNILVMTAAHCIWDRSAGEYRSDVYFRPQEFDGNLPLGQLEWESMVINPHYPIGEEAQANHDMAFIRFSPNHYDTLAHTGGAGLKTLSGFPKDVHLWGYPSNSAVGNDANRYRSMICRDNRVHKSFLKFKGSWVSECRFLGGASGGPWVDSIDREGNGIGYNFAVNSKVTNANSQYRIYGAPLDDMGAELWALMDE